jgi:hypothetical protein
MNASVHLTDELLQCMSPLMAHRVISLLYSNLVPFGEKRTSRYSARITERV